MFVLPTLEDGLGMVLLEAQSCALPSIVTSSAGAAECVEPGKTGWIVPAGQVGALTSALEEAMRNRHQLWEMGQKAREDVERYASADRLRELANWFYEPAGSEMCAG